MQSLRLLFSAAVLAVLCVVSSGQYSGGCIGRTVVFGDENVHDYSLDFVPGGLAVIFGTYTTPCDLVHFTDYVFTFTIPDQRTSFSIFSGSIPNTLRLALYTADLQTLVAQSDKLIVSTPDPNSALQDVVFANVPVVGDTVALQPNTAYVLVLAVDQGTLVYENQGAADPAAIEFSGAAQDGFPASLPAGIILSYDLQYPASYDGCCISESGICPSTTCPASGGGDPVFIGFHGQRFDVHGRAGRVYNVLSLPTLQLNTRFVPLSAGAALNASAQSSARTRQSRLISLLTGQKAGTAGTVDTLPSTTSWSHTGLYMGETGVLLAEHRLLVKPGAYVDGFAVVELDGVVVQVSEAVQLSGGSSVRRSSSSVLHITTPEVSFTLVNSDHFLNIHDAELTTSEQASLYIHGLLGQTAERTWQVTNTASFQRHLEADFMLPEGEDVWSTSFQHNRYEATDVAK